MTTKPKQAHTPTPWKVKTSNNYIGACIVANNDEKRICGTIIDFFESKEANANASFIVRACNSHEELLEACKQALDALNEIPWQTINRNQKNETDTYKIASIVSKAITKASGGA